MTALLLKFSVGQRLGLGFSALLALLLLVTGLAIAQIQAMSERTREVVETHNGKSALANTMLNSINIMSIQARSLTLLTDAKEIEVELKLLNQSQADYEKASAALLDLALASASVRVDSAAARWHPASGRRRYARAAACAAPLQRVHVHLRTIRPEPIAVRHDPARLSHRRGRRRPRTVRTWRRI